jgi:hypothetical protein
MWYSFMFVAVLLLAVMLARNWFLAAFSTGFVIWALSLPFHARLAIVISLATFNSAILVPFAPGPLLLADAGALLSWTGVTLMVILRRTPPDMGMLLHRNRFLLLGIAFYVGVLAVTMVARGVGFGMMGSAVGGGRIYFQQVIYAMIPMLFIVIPLQERQFLRLLTLFFVLSATFLISDLTVAFMPSLENVVLRLFQLPTDALTFETITTLRFGYRRLQSLFYVCPRLILALLIYYSINDVLGRRALVLIPVILLLMALGLGSGHRAHLIHTGVLLVALAWVQRAFHPRNVLVVLGGVIFATAMIYVFSPILPAAVQRSVSFLPGIQVSAEVAHDAASTWMGRLEVTKLGVYQIPEYFWLGRGFRRYADIIPYSREHLDSITFATLQGHYLNGFVGLMVNTGIFGTVAMCLFLFSGAGLAAEVVRKIRRTTMETNLTRAAAVIATLYLVDLIFFFLIEGNVEWALRRFGMLAGIMIACLRLLDRKPEVDTLTAEDDEVRAEGRT